jgi:hypothetical protein
MSNVIDNFFSAEAAIHDYFGYEEDWVKIPLEDNREYEWMLILNEDGGGTCIYHEAVTPESVATGKCYSGLIYTQRFLPKWVYEGADYTLVSMDTQTDGNKFLCVFDNTKRIKEGTRKYNACLKAKQAWDEKIERY